MAGAAATAAVPGPSRGGGEGPGGQGVVVEPAGYGVSFVPHSCSLHACTRARTHTHTSGKCSDDVDSHVVESSVVESHVSMSCASVYPSHVSMSRTSMYSCTSMYACA